MSEHMNLITQIIGSISTDHTSRKSTPSFIFFLARRSFRTKNFLFSQNWTDSVFFGWTRFESAKLSQRSVDKWSDSIGISDAGVSNPARGSKFSQRLFASTTYSQLSDKQDLNWQGFDKGCPILKKIPHNEYFSQMLLKCTANNFLFDVWFHQKDQGRKTIY